MASTDSKPLVVITGASSGIGKSCAETFAAAGHPLLLLARRVDRMEALGLPNAMCRGVDVRDLAALEAALAEAEEKYGPAELVVANSGVMLLGDIETQEPEEWTRMLEVNVIGVLNTMRAVIGKMRARKSGTIINISSIAGRKTFGNHAAYCGSKFAVHSITECVREECAAQGVRCIVVAPGVVETELLSHTSDAGIVDGYKQWKETMGKALEPVDVARVVKFAFEQPPHVTLREIVIGPTAQAP